MPRPPLPLGTWGTIRTYVVKVDAKGKAIRVRASTNYRDFDGVTRRVERYGKSKNAAITNLTNYLKDRARAGRNGELTASHRFREAVEIWLRKFDELVNDGRRSQGSRETYQRQLDKHILPALGELRLAELTTPVLDKFIGRIKADVGAATARTCRSVLSGVMALTVRYGALTTNPVRDIDRVEGLPTKEPRALNVTERISWLARLNTDEKAIRKDLPDLTSFMMATGVRIGEALAVLQSEVDLDKGTVEITSTIIRVTGVGLVRKPTKSRAGQRLLQLPAWAVEMLRRRSAEGLDPDRPVFPDSQGGFRDPSNTRRDLREARGSDDLAWITSHNFRKTTATMLDDAGLSARVVADQLGHARPSMTQDVYLSRRAVDPRSALALEAAFVTESGV